MRRIRFLRTIQTKKYRVDSYTKAIGGNIVGAEGLPVGIQISSLTYQDEQCMRVVKQIDFILQKNKNYPENRITKTWIKLNLLETLKQTISVCTRFLFILLQNFCGLKVKAHSCLHSICKSLLHN